MLLFDYRRTITGCVCGNEKERKRKDRKDLLCKNKQGQRQEEKSRQWGWRSTAGGDEKAVEKYIWQQKNQLTFKEYEDPFKDVKDFDDDSSEIPNEDLEKK